MRKLYSSLLVLMFTVATYAQDIHFSQYSASPLTLNPALTGNFNGFYRVSGIYRNQWPKLTSKFVTYSVSADIFEPNLYGGVGVRAMQNVEGEGVQKTNEFGLTYAYIIPIRSKRTDLAFAMGFAATRRARRVLGRSDQTPAPAIPNPRHAQRRTAG